MGNKSEVIAVGGNLSIEHIMPQNWIANWPLSCGNTGLPSHELWGADPNDTRAINTRKRNALVQTFGNLTILTQALNSAASNGPWADKKFEILRHSLLPINQQLQDWDIWDETAIVKRSDSIFEHALKLWPRD